MDKYELAVEVVRAAVRAARRFGWNIEEFIIECRWAWEEVEKEDEA